MNRRGTPGAGGYVLAVLVAMVVTDVGFLTSQGVTTLRHPADLALGLFWGMFYVTALAVPTAPVGVLIVHLTCRGVTDQRLHVLAAGLTGVLAGLFWWSALSSVEGLRHPWFLPLLLGAACALGRASVIPLMPVDDDSRRGVPAR